MTRKPGPHGPYDPPFHLDMDPDEALARFAQTDPRETPEEDELPLALIEDADTGDRFLPYIAKEGVAVDLRVIGKSFWATQGQMAEMFGVQVPAISKHLTNIFREGELQEAAVVSIKEITAADGKRYKTRLYNLNALISVGYRVESKLGTLFRIWATDKLVQYLTKGFIVDVQRLKSPDGDTPDHFEELLEIIRDIRSSEARMWTRVLELASFCSDYDKDNVPQHTKFFAEIQNTMHWAILQKTAAEIVVDEVSADKPNAGVIHFAGRQPTVEEAKTAKNLLGEMPIKALNHITSLTLEFFQSQAEQRRPTTLDQFLEKMRDLVRLDGRPVKPPGYAGKISTKAAEKHASQQVGEWKKRQKALKEQAGEKALTELAGAVKALPKPKKK